ncbi:MAG: helix-turn-helix transcriptional regulator [Planctomycetes bacterium]|nr:helix-turn-helix transcriptional regulator [Planctomycetota bacterium]
MPPTATASRTSATPRVSLQPVPRLRSAIAFDADRQVDFHTHDTAELVFVRLGVTWIEVAGKRLDGPAGTLYILPGKVAHNQRSIGRWKTQCLLLDHDGSQFDEAPRTLNLAQDPLFHRWMDDLCELSASNRRMADPVADALLFALLTRLAKLEDQTRMMNALHPSLARAEAFLQEHLTVHVAAERLAHAAHTSYSHLSALFRERFGCGPLRHHQNLRMELARKLLLNSYLSVDEVAQKVGYADTNYFVRVFRKTFGQPPGQWRKQKPTDSGYLKTI